MRERGTRGQDCDRGRADARDARDARVVDSLTAPVPGLIVRRVSVRPGTAAVLEDREPPRGGRHHEVRGAVSVDIPGRKGEHGAGIHLAPSYDEPCPVEPVQAGLVVALEGVVAARDDVLRPTPV